MNRKTNESFGEEALRLFTEAKALYLLGKIEEARKVPCRSSDKAYLERVYGPKDAA